MFSTLHRILLICNSRFESFVIGPRPRSSPALASASSLRRRLPQKIQLGYVNSYSGFLNEVFVYNQYQYSRFLVGFLEEP